MLIDLDDINSEVIKVVTETLEYYEMYRLCIMVNARYKRVKEIGRFVSAISHKYSNLNHFRVLCTEKFSK
jgi:hypothetical protein